MIADEKMRQWPVVACLDDENFNRLAGSWNAIRYAPEETIVDFDDQSADVYLVASGHVRAILRVAVGKELILGEFGPGELFGEMATLDGRPRSASLTALVQTQVMCIPESTFNTLIDGSPPFARHIMRRLSERNRDQTARIAELSFLDTRHRLYNTLLRLSRARGTDETQRVISPPVIHSELAEHIGSSREAVSREMSKLAKEKVIERTRGAIILHQPGELSRRISSTLQL